MLSREVKQQAVTVKLLDFIKVDPAPILNIFFNQQQCRLYVSRQTYSEIYSIAINEGAPVLQQITQFEPSLYFISIDNIMALFKPFELKIYRNERWEYHSFTTQLSSIRRVGNVVYSFHEKQILQWYFDQDSFGFNHVGQNHAPYHVDSDGSLSGLGKKVRHINKASKLTKCEVIQNQWVFVGDEQGFLHVYDWKFLSHVKTFHEHEAPILAIKISQDKNTVYFTGSDSKICLIKLVGHEWQLGEKIRGQSHDIMALQLVGDLLVSGGITTDFCFYPLQNGEFKGDYFHKVSYGSVNRISCEGKLVVVNNRHNFEIWSIGVNIHRTELLVRYEMPSTKYIVDCKLYRQEVEDGTYLLLIITDEDTIGWKFSIETGLTKYITIQNHYLAVQLLPKYCFLGVRIDGQLEKVNCLNGKIEQLIDCEIMLPTDIQYAGNGLVLLGSRIDGKVNIINIRKGQIVKNIRFKQTVAYLDCIDHQNLLVQYFNNPILYSIHVEDEKQTQIVKLPVNLIRFGGWLHTIKRQGQKQLKSKLKKYWFGVSEGKVLIVPNLQKEGKKKVRTRQTDRISQVIRPNTKAMDCSLAVIPFNFTRMINELPIKPVFTKKIV